MAPRTYVQDKSTSVVNLNGTQSQGYYTNQSGRPGSSWTPSQTGVVVPQTAVSTTANTNPYSRYTNPVQANGAVLGDSYVPGSSSSNPQNGGAAPTGGSNGGSTGGSNGPSDGDLINQEYNNFISNLDQQAGTANQNFNITQDRINRDQASGLTGVANEQSVRNQELASKAESGRQTERLNLQKVRQLLSELEQKQNAYGAVTGGGSSNEAMSDRFARTAQQNVGGVLQEGQRYQNDVNIEKLKSDQFYAAKTKEIQDWAKTQIENARMVLQDNLNNINTAKNQAGLNKAQARLDLWKQYQSTIDNAKLQAANFQTQYDMWKTQLDASLKASQGYQIGAINQFDASKNFANVANAGPTTQSTGVGYQLPNAAFYQSVAKKTQDEQNQLLK